MARTVISLTLRLRHRWLGLAFIGLFAIPADILGFTWGDKAVARIARIGVILMGPYATEA